MGLLGLVFCVFFKGRIMSVRAEMLQMPVPGMKKTPVLRGVLQGNMSLSCNILIHEQNFNRFLRDSSETGQDDLFYETTITRGCHEKRHRTDAPAQCAEKPPLPDLRQRGPCPAYHYNKYILCSVSHPEAVHQSGNHKKRNSAECIKRGSGAAGGGKACALFVSDGECPTV